MVVLSKHLIRASIQKRNFYSHAKIFIRNWLMKRFNSRFSTFWFNFRNNHIWKQSFLFLRNFSNIYRHRSLRSFVHLFASVNIHFIWKLFSPWMFFSFSFAFDCLSIFIKLLLIFLKTFIIISHQQLLFLWILANTFRKSLSSFSILEFFRSFI